MTLLWMPFSNYFALIHIATLSALYFPVKVYVLCYILHCNVTQIVFKKQSQKAKVTQEQNSNVSCIFPSTSAIHSMYEGGPRSIFYISFTYTFLCLPIYKPGIV